MTDRELRELLERKAPDELSAAELAELRRRLPHSAELRRALADQLELESCLCGSLDDFQVSVEAVLAAAQHTWNVWRRWPTWLGLGLGTVLLAVVGGFTWRSLRQARRPEAGPVAVTVERPIAPPAEAPERTDGEAAASVPPAVADEPLEPAVEAATVDEPWQVPEDDSSPSDRPLPAWPDDGPAPDFEQAAFTILDGPPLTAGALRDWFTPLVAHEETDFTDRPGQPPVIDGLAQLRTPWPDAGVLRLRLEEADGLRLHCWSGVQGVTIAYHELPAPQWQAFAVRRQPDQPRPIEMWPVANDGGRLRRSGARTLDLRWQAGMLVLFTGDVPLLTAPLADRPTDIVWDGRGAIRQLAWDRSAEIPMDSGDSPPEEQGIDLAAAIWQSEVSPGAELRLADDGSLALRAAPDALSWATWPTGSTALRDAVFVFEQLAPGAGVCLGDEQDTPRYLLGAVPDAAAGASRFVLAPASQADLFLADPAAAIPGGPCWLRLTTGCGTITASTSWDGRHWSPVEPPIAVPDDERACASIGLFCAGGPTQREVVLAQARIVEILALPALVDRALLARVVPQDGEAPIDFAAWLAAAAAQCPSDVGLDAWLRASAWQQAHSRSNSPLATELSLALLDDLLRSTADADVQRRGLDNAVRVLPTWGTPEGHALASALAQRYESLARSRQTTEQATPVWAALRSAIEAPWICDGPLEVVPASALRRELLERCADDDADGVRWLAQRIEFWAQPQPNGHGTNVWEPLELLAQAATELPQNEPASHSPALEACKLALQNGDYRAACQHLSRATSEEVAGLSADPDDPRVRRSFALALGAALAEHEDLPAAIRDELGELAHQRVRQAIDADNPGAVESAAMQFPGTDAASSAHTWLGDRALAAGDFVQALLAYRDAGVGVRVTDNLLARLRLASAMLGREVGEPVTGPVEIGGQRLAAEDFEALVAEAQAGWSSRPQLRLAPATSDALPWSPVSLAVQPWADVPWPRAGDDLANPRAGAGPAVLGAFDGHVLLGDGPRLVAVDASGAIHWSFDAWQGASFSDWDRWRSMPLVLETCVATRAAAASGRALVGLDRATGHVLWTVAPGGDMVCDPQYSEDGLWCLSATPETHADWQLSLALIDPASGVLAERPVLRVTGDASTLDGAALAVTDERIVAAAAGSVVCCDRLGRVQWVRRQSWVPPRVDPWAAERSAAVLVQGERLFVVQPGVPAVECLELGSGRRLWHRALADVLRVAGKNEDRLVLQTADRLTALDAESGAVLWERDDAAHNVDVAWTAAGQLLCLEHAGARGAPRMTWLDAATGQELAVAELPVELADDDALAGFATDGDRAGLVVRRAAGLELLSLTPAGEPRPRTTFDATLDAWRMRGYQAAPHAETARAKLP
jgi:hypothetical protein